jgi:hypothetical protein
MSLVICVRLGIGNIEVQAIRDIEGERERKREREGDNDLNKNLGTRDQTYGNVGKAKEGL